MDQQEKSAEPTIKEKDGGTKRLRSKVSTPTTIVTMQKQLTENRQLSFAHAVKMTVMKEAFRSDRLSNDDFDRVQIENMRMMDMTLFGSHMPKILRSMLQAGAAIILCEDDGTAD